VTKPTNIKLRVFQSIIGIKATFKDYLIVQIGFVFRQIINLHFKIESLKEISSSGERVLDEIKYKINPLSLEMKHSNVVMLDKLKNDIS